MMDFAPKSQPWLNPRTEVCSLNLSTDRYYREDKASLGRATEFCQTALAAFMDFAAKHGVPPTVQL
jgi:hypothetical protein